MGTPKYMTDHLLLLSAQRQLRKFQPDYPLTRCRFPISILSLVAHVRPHVCWMDWPSSAAEPFGSQSAISAPASWVTWSTGVGEVRRGKRLRIGYCSNFQGSPRTLLSAGYEIVELCASFCGCRRKGILRILQLTHAWIRHVGYFSPESGKWHYPMCPSGIVGPPATALSLDMPSYHWTISHGNTSSKDPENCQLFF